MEILKSKWQEHIGKKHGGDVPLKTNGWNLKIHPKGKGETSTSKPPIFGFQALVFGGVCMFSVCETLILYLSLFKFSEGLTFFVLRTHGWWMIFGCFCLKLQTAETSKRLPKPLPSFRRWKGFEKFGDAKVTQSPNFFLVSHQGWQFSRWWFQFFFIFTPTWGNDPIWLIFFKWVETTNWFFLRYPPEVYHSPWKWWLEDDPFLLGRPIFRGELLNFGRVQFYNWPHKPINCGPWSHDGFPNFGISSSYWGPR